jgi:hypothetical protein
MSNKSATDVALLPGAIDLLLHNTARISPVTLFYEGYRYYKNDYDNPPTYTWNMK